MDAKFDTYLIRKTMSTRENTSLVADAFFDMLH